MSLLATKAAPIGFALGSVGHGDGRVNGLALCRGDVRSSACTSCILTAGARIRDLCPRNKEAVVWYDECMVRYSDAAFFGDADYDQSFPLFNPRNTFNTRNVSDPKVFDGKVALLLERLKNKAYISPLMFAKQELEIGDQSRNLYGLAQCTKDISGGDCKKCLEAAINKLRRCCRGQRGARVVGGSCNMRYELYLVHSVLIRGNAMSSQGWALPLKWITAAFCASATVVFLGSPDPTCASKDQCHEHDHGRLLDLEAESLIATGSTLIPDSENQE
ncbi:hypothetical protein ZIOFF_002596 [Zingiber officinale]|uniref:Gnk2-homologous domain-containing protein n=1 Tax=Zingiber officinale TaxID=94328 RepID=A0A8J5HX46_ZINOF|nr:hypothetical protein ZIOFF_002596 [Zingiber officinale]